MKFVAKVLILLSLCGSVMASTRPVVGCGVWPGEANEGPGAYRAYANWVVGNAFHINPKGENGVDISLRNWTAPSCQMDDGRPKISALINGMTLAVNTRGDWSDTLQRVKAMREKFPNAAFSALLESVYWTSYAWNARGSGAADTVSQDAWKLFTERLLKAESVLVESKAYAADYPVWYQQMLFVQMALQRPMNERLEVFSEGARKFKTYPPIYFSMSRSLLPIWGGSWKAVEELSLTAVKNTKDTEGYSYYARIYWNAWQESPEGLDLFKDTSASWEKMRQGFNDLMSRHPNSKWNLNNFARFACMANDRATYLDVRKRMGADVVPEAWGRQKSPELCDAKLGFGS